MLHASAAAAAAALPSQPPSCVPPPRAPPPPPPHVSLSTLGRLVAGAAGLVRVCVDDAAAGRESDMQAGGRAMMLQGRDIRLVSFDASAAAFSCDSSRHIVNRIRIFFVSHSAAACRLSVHDAFLLCLNRYKPQLYQPQTPNIEYARYRTADLLRAECEAFWRAAHVDSIGVASRVLFVNYAREVCAARFSFQKQSRHECFRANFKR